MECCAVLKADPDDEKILERKVRTLCQMGKFQRAFALASQWLQKCPDVSETFTNFLHFSTDFGVCGGGDLRCAVRSSLYE